MIEREVASDIALDPRFLPAFRNRVNVVRNPLEKALHRKVGSVYMFEQEAGVQTVRAISAIVCNATRTGGKGDQGARWRVDF